MAGAWRVTLSGANGSDSLLSSPVPAHGSLYSAAAFASGGDHHRQRMRKARDDHVLSHGPIASRTHLLHRSFIDLRRSTTRVAEPTTRGNGLPECAWRSGAGSNHKVREVPRFLGDLNRRDAASSRGLGERRKGAAASPRDPKNTAIIIRVSGVRVPPPLPAKSTT
jgi:hypothetical protein